MAEAEINPTIAALYNSTKAALDFSLQKSYAAGNYAKRTTNQNFDFARGNAVRQAPQRFQANRNAANSAGLAESGILAQTQQRQAANLGQQLTGLSQQRQQAIQRINMGTFNAGEEHRVGLEQAGAREKKEQEDFNIANPPPAAATSSTASTTPGGVAYGTTQTPGGFVRVGPATVKASAGSTINEPRKKAMLKYTGGYGKRPGYSNPGY